MADAGEELDWLEMRARLITQEQDAAPSADGYVYESPLIEQGTILLGGTQQEFGFALRQQFFHKCVLLLLQHDDQFTKGIILNRPSALTLDGWRVWCGHGQVADGGMFVGADAARGELEINALHSLDGSMADELSTRVIKGVSYTSLEGAKALVAAGVAEKSDFWICVGYSGWAPGQLQMEVEQRDSWYMAATDSGTLLKELLRQGAQLPEGGVAADHGIDTWSSLMRGIGREADAQQSEGCLADKMLGEWVRRRLLPTSPVPTPSTPPPAVQAGTVLCSTVPSTSGHPPDRVLLDEQFLHKALLLVLGELPGGVLTACVLNRPTATVMQFKVPGSPKRRLAYSGNRRKLGGGEDADRNGQLWLHHRSELGGAPLGDSGLFRLPSAQLAAALQAGEVDASDLLLANGVVELKRAELAGMISAGEMCIVPAGAALSSLWPRVWSLTEDDGDDVGDGTEVWWLASQLGRGEEAAAAPPPSELADEALAEWIKFFAS